VRRCRRWPAWPLWLAGLALPALAWGATVGEGADPFGVVDAPTLELRREYNDVAAAIDTIARTYGRDQVNALTAADRELVHLPTGSRIVVLFWADDEAQLYLNGNPIGRTRLTPTRVEVPAMYLEAQNELRAHCWDTDRVESGFMAGLYAEDAAGDLHTVLATSESRWSGDGGEAQEIYYTHTQPDIPEAEVMWGERLFGEVRLVARFSAAEVLGALQAPAVGSVPADWRDEPMHFHQVVSRLARLQTRRRELGEVLRASAPGLGAHLRYGGETEGGLSFTLGRAAPLAAAANAALAEDLAAWVRHLPERQRELVLHEERQLKGVEQMTPAAAFEGSRGESPDRRADYQPPPERGPQVVGQTGSRVAAAVRRAGARRARLWLWLAAAGLGAYVTLGAGQWWRVYHSQRWDRV